MMTSFIGFFGRIDKAIFLFECIVDSSHKVETIGFKNKKILTLLFLLSVCYLVVT